jgi:hypothetical protein
MSLPTRYGGKPRTVRPQPGLLGQSAVAELTKANVCFLRIPSIGGTQRECLLRVETSRSLLPSGKVAPSYQADFRHEIANSISRFGVSARCRVSNRPDQLSTSCLSMQPSTITSTFRANSWASPWARNRRGGGSGSIRRVLFPAHRSDRALQHSSNPDGLRTGMKFVGAQVQRALRCRRSATLPQIVVPRWAMVALRP